jgi:hypothetical protein
MVRNGQLHPLVREADPCSESCFSSPLLADPGEITSVHTPTGIVLPGADTCVGGADATHSKAAEAHFNEQWT